MAQEDLVKAIWGRVLAVVHDVEEAVVDITEFQNLLKHAANAEVFDVWPFQGSTPTHSSMATATFYLPDLVYAASNMQKLPAVFPYLDLLFSSASASQLQPNECPALHEALSLLAEAHDLPQSSADIRSGITNLMGKWGIRRGLTAKSVVVWSTEAQASQIGLDSKETVLWVIGALHAEMKHMSDCSPTAALQLVPVPPPPAEPIGNLEETVHRPAQKAANNKTGKPNGKEAIMQYIKTHTVPYSGDFNKEMVRRKQEREAEQRKRESRMVVNTLLFTTMLQSGDEGSEGDEGSKGDGYI